MKARDIIFGKNRESEAKKNWQEIIDWVIDNNRLPSISSSELSVKRMARRIASVKSSKLGRGTKCFYSFYHDMIDGHPNELVRNLLQDKEQRAREKWQEVIDWIVENNRSPYKFSKDQRERKLAVKIESVKRAKSGKGGKYYSFYDKMLNDQD